MLKDLIIITLYFSTIFVALLSTQVSAFIYISTTLLHVFSIKNNSVVKYILFSILYLPVSLVVFPIFVWTMMLSLIQSGDYNPLDEERLFHKKLLYKISFYNIYLFNEDNRLFYQ